MKLWNSKLISILIKKGAIEWHRHVFERMLERGISRCDVTDVLITGEVIEDYPSDYPYPSVLMHGKLGEKPLHVVAAFDSGQEVIYIITAYFPDAVHFMSDYKTRRK